MFIATLSTWSVIGTLLQILGSLGVFLFGLKVMSEGGKRSRETACAWRWQA